jgi:methylated-DNA-[protein]-cysteine S-methyltransferase
MEPRYCLFDTAFGPCGIAWNERGVVRLQLPESDRAATERRLKARSGGLPAEPTTRMMEAIADIQRYMRGTRVDFTAVPLDVVVDEPFRKRVYEALRLVPWGETVTYGELARRVGAAGQAREVGQVMGRNPVPVIVPCHRVLAAGNKAGGFSAYGGTFTKERLLALEGVTVGVEADAPALPGILAPQRRAANDA